jgi:hypothetical protein
MPSAQAALASFQAATAYGVRGMVEAYLQLASLAAVVGPENAPGETSPRGVRARLRRRAGR